MSVAYQEHAATPFCFRSRIRAAVNNNSCCKSTRLLAVTYEYKTIKSLTLMLDGETVKHKISKWTDLVTNNYQGLHGNMKSICLTYLTRLRQKFCLGWLYLPFCTPIRRYQYVPKSQKQTSLAKLTFYSA